MKPCLRLRQFCLEQGSKLRLQRLTHCATGAPERENKTMHIYILLYADQSANLFISQTPQDSYIVYAKGTNSDQIVQMCFFSFCTCKLLFTLCQSFYSLTIS